MGEIIIFVGLNLFSKVEELTVRVCLISLLKTFCEANTVDKGGD